MSSPELKKALAEIEKKSMEKAYPKSPKKTDVLPRREYEKEKGQILILNEIEYLSSIQPLYKESIITQKIRKPLFKKIDAYFKAGEARLQMDKETLAQTKLNAAKLKKETLDHIYIVSSFDSAKSKKFKESNQVDVSHITADFLNKTFRTNVSAKKISGKHDLGHGDRGMSAAEYTMARETRRAAKKFNLTAKEEKMLQDVILMERKKLPVKVNFEHKQVLDSKGNLKKDWSVILSFQDRTSNRKDRDVEAALKLNIRNRFDKIALNPNSTPLVEAISKVLMWNFKPRQNMKVTGSRVSKIKEEARAGYRKKHTYGRNTPYGVQRGLKISRAAFRQPKVERKKVKNVPSLLNKNLGKTIQDNMQSPGLENQTGNFANSVRVLKQVMGSGRTLPTIQYTYDADPYQVFETGAKGDRRWATPARDPRLLIEKSIREVARQFALGKFKVQRM